MIEHRQKWREDSARGIVGAEHIRQIELIALGRAEIFDGRDHAVILFLIAAVFCVFYPLLSIGIGDAPCILAVFDPASGHMRAIRADRPLCRASSNERAAWGGPAA